METFSALLAICAGNSPVTGEFPAQRPVTRIWDLRRDRTHYDAIVMGTAQCKYSAPSQYEGGLSWFGYFQL